MNTLLLILLKFVKNKLLVLSTNALIPVMHEFNVDYLVLSAIIAITITLAIGMTAIDLFDDKN